MTDHISTEEAERIAGKKIWSWTTKDCTLAADAIRSLAAERDELAQALTGRTVSCAGCDEAQEEIERLREEMGWLLIELSAARQEAHRAYDQGYAEGSA